ncbi:uncharacterized protein LOC122248273 [Penaeus japonicus]|nr:uncharacterized protein LOC122248273 [Penaeus japonicus]
MMAANSAFAFKNLEVRQYHRISEMVNETAREPLQYVFEKNIAGKSPTEDIANFYMRKGAKKMRLNETQRETVKSDPECRNFDITLLYEIIHKNGYKLKPPNNPTWYAHGDTLEYNLTNIKNFRNAVSHLTFRVDTLKKFEDKVQELTNILRDTWRNIGIRYGEDLNNKVMEMEKAIYRIKNMPLEEVDIKSYKQTLLFENLQKCMDNEGKKSLKETYMKHFGIAPDVSLLVDHSGKSGKPQILEVFTDMECSRPTDNLLEREVRYETLLSKTSKPPKEIKGSTLIVLIGIAGVGKTTLTKKLALDWANSTISVEYLKDYDYVIYMQFREPKIKTLSELLIALMPAMKGKLHKKDLLTLIEDRTILFVCDGFDEENSKSKRLFKEILNFGKTHHITVVCSTRPSHVQNAKLLMPSEFTLENVSVLGIPECERINFIKNYFKVFNPDEEPTSLLSFLKKTTIRLQDHWRLPYNLVCLTYLWVTSPDRVNNLTTETELFKLTNEEHKKKLVKRLFEKDSGTLTIDDLERNISEFLKTLQQVALRTRLSGDVILPKSSLGILKKECLPDNFSEEILSSFLVENVLWTDLSSRHYSFHHNRLQDFYAAKSIFDTLVGGVPDTQKALLQTQTTLQNCNIPKDMIKTILNTMKVQLDSLDHLPPWTIRKILEKSTGKSGVKDLLQKSQRVLIHLMGIMKYEGKSLKEDMVKEVVDLLGESGIKGEREWLDLLEEVKCDEDLVHYILSKMNMDTDSLMVEDSHVRAYLLLLPCLSPETKEVTITIRQRTEDVPGIEELLEALYDKLWKQVIVYMWHDFYYPCDVIQIDCSLCKLFSRCNMIEFLGQVSKETLKSLP